jgi:DNA-binding GntR family transcriptional regulator
MSTTPIREALNLLRQEGFVDVFPRRGTLVRAIEIADVQNTFLLRSLLEPEAAALAAARASAEQLRGLTALTRSGTARTAEGSGNEPSRFRGHRLFHEAIAEASGIRELVPIIRGLHERVEWFYAHERIRTPDESIHERERALLDAIVGGGADEARRLMTENIRASRQHVIESLISEPIGSGLALVSDGAAGR